jgi:hypothetical protein
LKRPFIYSAHGTDVADTFPTNNHRPPDEGASSRLCKIEHARHDDRAYSAAVVVIIMAAVVLNTILVGWLVVSVTREK